MEKKMWDAVVELDKAYGETLSHGFEIQERLSDAIREIIKMKDIEEWWNEERMLQYKIRKGD